MKNLIFLIFFLLVLNACTKENYKIKNGEKDEIEAVPQEDIGVNVEEESIESLLTKNEAIKIAIESDCIKDGEINPEKESGYNPNSKTWWIGMESDKKGCNPACVVFEDGSTEVNWRCTGLVN